MSILALLFLKFLNPKKGVTQMSKWSCFRTPFGNQRVNGFQTLLKSALQHYLPTFPLIKGKLSWRKSALVISEILRRFVNTLTPDDKYSRSNVQNFPQQFQTSLFQKVKTFSSYFFAFLKCALNLEHFQKKDEYPSPVSSEIL